MTDMLLTIDGAVENPTSLSFGDFAAIDSRYQVKDVSRLDPKRNGDAVSLEGLLQLVRPAKDADYLTLHASKDDFHASIPLASVRAQAILIYRLNGGPLPQSAGGPLRFFIPDRAACHTHEVDDCANVKFVDRIELSRGKGEDNRPHDDEAHEELHRKESAG